jgi:hypothetical protein
MTVSDQIIQVLNDLCEKFGLAIDWTGENVIPYVTALFPKFISYEIWTSVASMGIAIMFCIISFVLIKIFYPTFKAGWEANSRSYTDMGWQMAGCIAMGCLAALYVWTVVTLCCETMDIITCTTFPELAIIEYLQELLGSAS